jgi:hypothetical protein
MLKVHFIVKIILLLIENNFDETDMVAIHFLMERRIHFFYKFVKESYLLIIKNHWLS